MVVAMTRPSSAMPSAEFIEQIGAHVLAWQTRSLASRSYRLVPVASSGIIFYWHDTHVIFLGGLN